MPPRKRGAAPPAAPVEVKYARTRLYKKQSETATHVKLVTKEGFAFTHRKDAGDLVEIGAYDSEKKISETAAHDILKKCRTFLYLEFIKADGTVRKMYARIRESKHMLCFELQDLELMDKDIRQCRADRLVCFIVDHVRYIVKK